MPDLLSYELVEAMAQPGCPVCTALDIADERWIKSFWREGRYDRGARQRFFAAGGYCPRHAWLLHESVADAKGGAAIADLYGNLADLDSDRLGRLLERLSSPSRRRRRTELRRKEPCPACVERTDETERDAYFLTQALAEAAVRRRYAGSDGLCFEHLAAVVGYASEEDPDVACFLLDDWRRRLSEHGGQLAEFDRKRDYRYRSEPRGDEQHSWTDVIALYTGRAAERAEKRELK
jgi:hypothetical protein